MSGHFNAVGDVNFLKNNFTKNLQAGEKLTGFEFEMQIAQYPNVTVLVRSTQYPAMGRSQIEDFAPMGLKFVQQGAFENSGEIVVTAVETLSGEVLKTIRQIVKNKEYVDITIRSTPESLGGNGAESALFKLSHCAFRSDAIDLSTEDQAALVKPSINITYNWFDL